MSAQAWIELMLLVLMALNLLILGGAVAFALRKVSALSQRLDAAVADIQRDTVTALQETRTALTKLSELTTSLDHLVRSEVGPTLATTRSMLGRAETAVQGVTDATGGVRRILAGAESLSTPAALVGAVERMTKTPAGRMGLIAAAALAAVRGFAATRRRAEAATTE